MRELKNRVLKTMLLFVLLSVCCFCLLPSSVCFARLHREQDSSIRLALLIGHNRAGGRIDDLLYAEKDAKKVRDLLVQIANYKQEHIWLLLGRPASVLTRTLQEIKRKIRRLRARYGPKKRILLFVYYSGHAMKGKLLLGRSSLRFQRLKTFLKQSGATLRFAVFDACESGRLTKMKGLKKKKESFRFPVVRLAPPTRGEIIIAATGSNDSAHEDSRLKGGIFTHYFLSGLRGAADRNKDGFVTLEEAYTYSYNRTLERTMLSKQGPQRARFSKKLSGYGSLILTRLSKKNAWLQLEKNVVGEFFIWNLRRDLLIAEIIKHRNKTERVALAPGAYILQWRHKKGLYNQQVELKRGEKFVLQRQGQKLAYLRLGQARGGKQIKDDWTLFRGQLQGTGLAASYKAGFSGLEQGVFHQGASLSVLIPIETTWSFPFSLLIQANYQHGTSKIKEELVYKLHMIEADIAGLWTVFERPFVWIGTGVAFRFHTFLHFIQESKQQPAMMIPSFAGGAGSLTSFQFGLGARTFLQWNFYVGGRILNLGGPVAIRWDLDSSLGLGIRF